MSMKIIVAGGRKFMWNPEIHDKFKRFLSEFEDVEIVCGGAKGADAFGKEHAEMYGLGLKMFPADWDKHGRSAGPIRNTEMANYADMLVAFWDGESKGTKHMIDQAKKKGLRVFVKRY